MNYRINPTWAINDAALAFNVEIAAYVRAELLAYLAEGEGTTSDYPHRAGMILTPEAQNDREWFESVFGIRVAPVLSSRRASTAPILGIHAIRKSAKSAGLRC